MYGKQSLLLDPTTSITFIFYQSPHDIPTSYDKICVPRIILYDNDRTCGILLFLSFSNVNHFILHYFICKSYWDTAANREGDTHNISSYISQVGVLSTCKHTKHKAYAVDQRIFQLYPSSRDQLQSVLATTKKSYISLPWQCLHVSFSFPPCLCVKPVNKIAENNVLRENRTEQKQ